MFGSCSQHGKKQAEWHKNKTTIIKFLTTTVNTTHIQKHQHYYSFLWHLVMLKETCVGQPINFSPLSKWSTLLSRIKAKVLGRNSAPWHWRSDFWLDPINMGPQTRVKHTQDQPRPNHGWTFQASEAKILLAMSSVRFKLLPFAWNLTNNMFQFLASKVISWKWPAS